MLNGCQTNYNFRLRRRDFCWLNYSEILWYIDRVIVGDILEDQAPGTTSAVIDLLVPENGGSTSQLSIRNYLPANIVFIPEDLNFHQYCYENLK
jgi:hypothetical protein